MQLQWVPHQERLRGFPRLRSASSLQPSPFRFDPVCSALLENSGQDLGLLPHVYPISSHPQSQRRRFISKRLSPPYIALCKLKGGGGGHSSTE